MANNVTFRQWIVDLFKDERGSTSIKPVVALLGAFFLCLTMTANSFSEDRFKPSDKLVELFGLFELLRLFFFNKLGKIFLRCSNT